MIPDTRLASPAKHYVGNYHYSPLFHMWSKVIGVTGRGFRLVAVDRLGRRTGEVRIRKQVEAYLFARRPFQVTQEHLGKVKHK